MIKQTCAVSRPQWGFVMQQQGPKLAGIGTAMGMEVKNVAVNHHELRIWGDPEEFLMYCIFCGQITTQSEWAATLSLSAVNNGRVDQ